MVNDYFQQATNPHQYDSEMMDWKIEGLEKSPTRQLFQEYLESSLDIKGMSVIDIGSGMGQLFPLLKQLGATKITGLEPSVKNIQASKHFSPDIEVYGGTLAEVDTRELFDAAISVMVFEHIPDLTEAFKKVCAFLKPGGKFYLIAADKSYAVTPRFDYKLEIVDIGDGEVVVKTIRPLGALYDVLRPTDSYVKTAEIQGLVLEKKIEIKPTQTLMELSPKYLDFLEIPMSHLFVFRKKN